MPPGFFEDALRGSRFAVFRKRERQCPARRAHVAAWELRAFAKKCVDPGGNRSLGSRAPRVGESCGVSETVAYAHSPAGLGEVAHGGVEERFGGLVHGRARREGCAVSCDRRPKPFA